MRTYVLGAGASYHAGYPLCAELWPAMAAWVVQSQDPSTERRKAIDMINLLCGPIIDLEKMLTDLDLGRGAFRVLTEDQRITLRGKIKSCLYGYLKSIFDLQQHAPLYQKLAGKAKPSDTIITFNYDVAVENELIRAQKFTVRNGYGFDVDWIERESEIKLLKLHGSMNWTAPVFPAGQESLLQPSHPIGTEPYIDNKDGLLREYPVGILSTSFQGPGVTHPSVSLIMPSYEKRFSVSTSEGPQWPAFYRSLWFQAADALQAASEVVLIGYSMPKADHLARALLLWSANRRAEIVLRCAASNQKLKRTFEKHGFWYVHDGGDFEAEFAG